MHSRIFAVYANNKISIQTNYIGKFSGDELFVDEDSRVIAVQGIILNSGELYEKKSKGLLSYITEQLEQGHSDFYKSFRGNFSGVVYDKISKRGVAFTDHFGTDTMFYYKDNEQVVISTSAFEIAAYLKRQGKNIKNSLMGSYELLTYGYMLKDTTIYEGIKRILPGCYIEFTDKSVEICQYYSIRNNEISITESEAVEEVDRLFLKAVELQAKKNQEYQFTNYAALSAGLDARMTCYALKKLGFEDVTTFTYSQSNELDEILPRKMASDMGYVWLFKNLDNGLDMFDIDSASEIADGIQYYLWPAQLNGFMKLVDSSRIGAIHTGIIGDVVVGTFYKQLTKKKYELGDGAYSRTLISRVKDLCSIDDMDYEVGMMYNRAFNGANQGYAKCFLWHNCQLLSPFMNVDFYDFCLSLPLTFRIGHILYYKWVLKKMPEAARFSHNGLKIRNSKRFVTFQDRPIPVNGIMDRVISRLKTAAGLQKGMNPIKYWYSDNERLKKYMDGYFDQHVSLISDQKLREDTIALYRNGTTMEKTLSLSLVGTLNQIARI